MFWPLRLASSPLHRSNCSFWMGAKRKTHITFKLGKCLRARFRSERKFADFTSVSLVESSALSGQRQLGKAGEQMIVEKYSLEAVLPRMLKMYEGVLNRKPMATRTEIESGNADEMVTQSLKLKAPRSPFLG